MKLILDGTDNEVFDPATDLRVLVAYPNAAFALRAKAMLARVAQDAGKFGRLIYSLWDFNSLAEPVLQPIAAEEALAADIVLFAAPEGKALPKGVREWIARWLVTKNELPQAMVASLHTDPATAPNPPVVLTYLARVAKYGGMNFFAGGGEAKPPVNLAKFRAELAETAGPVGMKNPPSLTASRKEDSAGQNLYANVVPAAQPLCRPAA